ncbi:MAG: nuclear transport factor 2 family protein [Gammaproteobacteria bacterium]|nr:nuclear transport factor 2 family protein [Gammaproteobacteria bacterium]
MSDFQDRMEIQHLAQRYADGVMQRDPDIWGSTWATNGVWILGGGEPVSGREAVVEFWSSVMKGYPLVLHWVQPGLIEVNGDAATARFYIQEKLRDAQDGSFYTAGVYNDVLIKEDGAWKFQLRAFSAMYRGPADLSGDWVGYPTG